MHRPLGHGTLRLSPLMMFLLRRFLLLHRIGHAPLELGPVLPEPLDELRDRAPRRHLVDVPVAVATGVLALGFRVLGTSFALALLALVPRDTARATLDDRVLQSELTLVLAEFHAPRGLGIPVALVSEEEQRLASIRMPVRDLSVPTPGELLVGVAISELATPEHMDSEE